MANWNVIFFRSSSGREPARDFIESLPTEERAKVYGHVEILANKGVLLEKPFVDHIDGKIWELRISITKREVRMLYFMTTGKTAVLLHGFVKKTQRTPRGEIEIAVRRMRQYLNRP